MDEGNEIYGAQSEEELAQQVGEINTEATFNKRTGVRILPMPDGKKILIPAPEELLMRSTRNLSNTEKFLEKYQQDVHRISFEWFRLKEYENAARSKRHAVSDIKEAAKLLDRVCSLVEYQLNTISAMFDLTCRGYRLQVGILARNCIESASVAIETTLEDAKAIAFDKGKLKTSQSRKAAGQIIQYVNEAYSELSEKYVHISPAHGTLQWVSWTKSDHSVLDCLGYLKYCLVMTRLCLEIAFGSTGIVTYPQLVTTQPHESGKGIKITPIEPQSDYWKWFMAMGEVNAI